MKSTIFFRNGVVAILTIMFIILISIWLTRILITKKELFTNKLDHFKSIWKTNPVAYRESLDMLQTFHNFCEEKSIPYFLMYGTLLGQVRHSGFIPWDDDMDIMVDSEKFNKVYKLLNTTKYKIVVYRGYYKLFLREKAPIKNYPWSWPFLDIFTFKKYKGDCYLKGTIEDKIDHYPNAYFFPLKKGIFENKEFYIPNDPPYILTKLYGSDWSKTCKSGTWIHSTETSKENYDIKCSEIS